MKTPRRYLEDILENLERIESFTVEGQEAFIADDKTQYAVIRAYEVIGEAAKRLPQDLVSQQPEINWSQIKGFRDFLIHSYDRIDLRLIWVAVVDIPRIRAAVLALLQTIEDA